MEQPVAGVRIVRLDGEYLINPSMEQTKNADISLVVAGSMDGICMVEGGGKEAEEAAMMKAMDLAFVEIKKIIGAIEELREKAGQEKFAISEPKVVSEEIAEKLEALNAREALVTALATV